MRLQKKYAITKRKKRNHKDTLLKGIMIFLGCQFGLFFVLLSGVICMIIVAHFIGNNMPIDIITLLLSMLKDYMIAIVAEMIAMLFFIVRNVFDTTIPDLAKLFANETDKDFTNSHKTMNW